MDPPISRDRARDVKHRYSGYTPTLSDRSVRPTRQDRMVVWVFIRVCISVEKKSTGFYFARDVFALPRIREIVFHVFFTPAVV